MLALKDLGSGSEHQVGLHLVDQQLIVSDSVIEVGQKALERFSLPFSQCFVPKSLTELLIMAVRVVLPMCQLV